MKSKILDVPDFNGMTIYSIDIYQHTIYIFFDPDGFLGDGLGDGFVTLRAEKPDKTLARADSVVLIHTLIDHEIKECYIETTDIELILRIHTVGGIGYVSFAGHELKMIIDYSQNFKHEDTTLG